MQRFFFLLLSVTYNFVTIWSVSPGLVGCAQGLADTFLLLCQLRHSIFISKATCTFIIGFHLTPYSLMKLFVVLRRLDTKDNMYFAWLRVIFVCFVLLYFADTFCKKLNTQLLSFKTMQFKHSQPLNKFYGVFGWDHAQLGFI